MTRSRRRKLQRIASAGLMAAAGPVLVHAQQAPMGLDEIIVTAQKREESLQDVPISVQALGNVKLEQLNVTDFDDYANLLPSVSFVTIRPGYAQVYMRGVASAGDADANHSGSLPLIGTYLDEQPITTIQGALDVHLYDIARVEALAGPQGTLYGASSEAGTVKIVTNKPDPSGFAAGYGIEGNVVSGGDQGYVVEGFLNQPLADNMAIRLVAWAKHDAGYIDNVPFQRTFQSTTTGGRTPIETDNAAFVDDDYNGVDTVGARAALRIDLNDRWTFTPSLMAQKQKADGSFGADNTLGRYQVGHGLPEGSDDKWWQAALTVEGRIGSWDMVYAGSYLDRDVEFDFDYADYSYWYDAAYLDPNGDGFLPPFDSDNCGVGECFSDYFTNDLGDPIDFSQYVQSTDGYEKISQELRFSSPQEYRLRALVGAFWQRQEHAIYQNYIINDLAESLSVAGSEDTLWLTEQDRVDEDYALFGELYYDITEKLTGTIGARVFKSENSLEGYFGFGQGYSNSGSSGEALCDVKSGDGLDDPNTPAEENPIPGADLPDYGRAPCKNLDDDTSDRDTIWKFNLAYELTDDALVYATYSEGFRPGGINRRGTVPPYEPDFLDNYEVGWKTSWLEDRLRFNGALFYQEWNDFQYSILGPNGLTEVTNAPGDAEIKGLEMDISWAVTDGLAIAAGIAVIDAELAGPYCQNLFNGAAVSADPCPVDGGGTEEPAAPEGTKLPVTPDFKGNITGRYQFALGALDAHVQAAVIYVGERETDLRTFENGIVGQLPDYTLTNFSAGAGVDGWAIEFFVANAFNEYAEFSRFAECPEAKCGPQTYSIVAPPRTIGVKFSQEF